MLLERFTVTARLASALLLLASFVTAQEPETRAASAEPGNEVYFVAELADLVLEDGVVPIEPFTRANAPSGLIRIQGPDLPAGRALLDGPGDAYVLRGGWGSLPRAGSAVAREQDGAMRNARIAIRLPEARDLRGTLFLPTREGEGQIATFLIEASWFGPQHRDAFLYEQRVYFDEHVRSNISGAAWWRHRYDEALEAAGDEQEPDETARRLAIQNPRRRNTIEDSFSLFSGGRAVAENLQLDRLLPATPVEEADVPLDSIGGITTPDYDWSALIAGLSPDTDPLAARIPHDQHAIFFPDFDSLAAMTDHVNDLGGPMLDVFDDNAADERSHARIEQQLGLPMSALSRILGPTVIRSVAITGSDPYLRTGTDVALLFEAVNAKWLHSLISSRLAGAMMKDPRSERYLHAVRQIPYARHYTPDRKLDSYVAAIDDMIVVTNSLQQLHRLVEVWEGERESLASLPEYSFFRDRYPRGAEGETALLVLSDATIRRWCGPQWRIGSSRRTRAAAALADLQAGLVHAPLATEEPMSMPPAGLDEVTLGPDGPQSSTWGTPAFLTPIIELDLDQVTETEADLYRRWRDGYQQNWTGVFDPIAVRFGVGEDRLALDVTVRPLIASSEYRGLIEMASGSEIEPGAGDPHDALLQWTMAIDAESMWLGQEAAMLKMLFPQMDPLGWVGGSVSVYVDDSPFWDDMIASDDIDDFLEASFHRLPVALHAEVNSNVLLASFLVGVRAMVEQSAPGMMRWENATWAEEPYVTVRPSEQAQEDLPEEAAIHYAASGQGLTVTLSEELLKRAIERRIARRAADAEENDADATRAPLGKHVAVRIGGRAIELMETLAAAQDAHAMREVSFANLPILNEWKRLYPEEDPVAFHERVWHERLFCPGSGEYVWNEEWQTMESTVYGHPLAPRVGPQLPTDLLRITSGAAGLTFEEDGLRARVELAYKPR